MNVQGLTNVETPALYRSSAYAAEGVPAGLQALADGMSDGAAGDALRRRVGEFVGSVFYGTLLRQMQQSSLKGEYMHGGRGEEVFQGQLGLEIAQRLGRAANDPIANRLYQSMQHRLGARSQATAESAEELPGASTDDVSPRALGGAEPTSAPVEAATSAPAGAGTGVQGGVGRDE